MRIVELLIEELEELSGFTEVALVKDPAIELPFFAFKENNVEDAIAFQTIKQLVKDQFVERLPGESRDDYMGRCIPVLKSEGFPEDQALAICYDTFDIDVSTLPDYNNNISGSINYEFESFTDYPQSATNAAKRALEWRDEHPDQGCLTRVGWARANQLANREPISEETIARMASFARHLQHEDVPFSEGCGGLAVAAWGGRAGIQWAQRKLEEIREGLSQEFSYFNDLPDNIQDKLLENLSNTGISREKLQKDGYVIEDYEESPNLTFALPTKADANPDKPTNDTSGNFKILYEYDVRAGKGPKIQSNTRDFCRRLIGLNLLFRKEDIDRLTIKGANSEEFGFYNIFRYKGSFNCRHFWRKKRVYQKQEENPASIKSITSRISDLPSANVAPGVNSSIGDSETVAFSKYNFGMDEDKKIVVGPLMVPNRLIFRVDENDEPYYVYFSEDTIKKISQKMMKEKLLDKMNLEHDPGSPIDGHMIETWIVEDEMNDKSNSYGMNLPKGTWVGAYQINDNDTWDLVKNGTVTGFSLEGFFESKAIQN